MHAWLQGSLDRGIIDGELDAWGRGDMEYVAI